MLSCPLILGTKRCMLYCLLILVAPNARIVLKGLKIVLGLLICKEQHIDTPRFAGIITHC